MTPCPCDPTIVCDQLDCGGCECRMGTCAVCTATRLPRPRPSVMGREPTVPTRPAPWPCQECAHPMLTSRWLREHPEDRDGYRSHGGHGQCELCRRRALRRERLARGRASLRRHTSAGVWAGEVWLTRSNGRVTRARYGEPDPGPPPEEPRTRPVRISGDKQRQVLELHQQGYTNRHVARVVGVGPATVSRIVRAEKKAAS